MSFDHERHCTSRWATVVSIAEKIGCVPQTLHEWVKKAEVDSGERAGVPAEVADKVKALACEVRSKRGRQTADYAACATGSAVCADQFQGMSSSHRAAGQSAAIFPVTSAM
jgi:transposase-like protein